MLSMSHLIITEFCFNLYIIDISPIMNTLIDIGSLISKIETDPCFWVAGNCSYKDRDKLQIHWIQWRSRFSIIEIVGIE